MKSEVLAGLLVWVLLQEFCAAQTTPPGQKKSSPHSPVKLLPQPETSLAPPDCPLRHTRHCRGFPRRYACTDSDHSRGKQVRSRSKSERARRTLQRNAPIQADEGTSLGYAANTQDKVIKTGDLYYLCFQGVWFMSTALDGPWQTANSVPKEIYIIPPSSPVYNVTYVTQTNSTPTTIESSTTAGYVGMFVLGVTAGVAIAYGTTDAATAPDCQRAAS